MIGETLGKFRILSTIGKGGMGVVYLAEHTLIGRKAAVKLLLPEMSRDEELVERFFNEAKAAAAAQHAGLVEVFDFGWTDDGSAYIVMEHLKGESLAVRMERQPRFAPELALSVMRQVASALAAAHEQGVVHRDLKPENVYLLPDSSAPAGVRIKVLDFGIAKLARDEERRSVKTRTGVVIGTPRYMSPEQCKSASNVDARTDIYALGCITYEMLVGKPPFDYDNWGELVAAHIHERPPTVRERVPDISPEVEAIVMRAIAKDPAERYQTMTELAQAIDTLWPGANSSLVFTPMPGTLKTLGDANAAPTIREPRRSRAPLFAMLAGAVVLAGVTAVVVAQRTSDEPEPQPKPSVVVVPVDAAVAKIEIDAPPAPRAKVKLVVNSVPSGARVDNLDGVTLGKTPLVREIDPVDGKLELVVKLAGFKDLPVTFDAMTGGEQTVTLQKVPKVSGRPRPQPRPQPGSGSGVLTLDPYK